MDKSRSLYKLIHSLDKKEVSLIRKSLKNKTNIGPLFKLYLQETKGIKNAKFQKKEAVIQNLPVLKSRLYSLIVANLAVNNTVNNDKIALNKIDNNILVLVEKGLLKESLQEIKKGYLYADKLGDSYYLLNFTKRLLQIRTLLPEKMSPTEWFSETELESKIKSVIVDTYILKNWLPKNNKCDSIQFDFKELPFLREDEDVVENLIIPTKINYHIRQANISMLKKEEQSISLLIKAIKAFAELDVEQTKVDFWKNSFYSLNLGVIITAIEWNHKQVADEYLTKIERSSELSSVLIQTRPLECFRMLFLCKFESDNKEKIFDLVELVKAIDEKVGFLKNGLNLYHFSICHAFFILNEKELFFEYAYMMLSISKADKNYSEDNYYQTRLLELMLNFEQKNDKHNLKLVQALKNYIWYTRGNLHPFEKKFFTIFSNTIHSVSKKDFSLLITDIKLELKKEETKDYMVGYAPYINFVFWLERASENY